MIWYDFQSKAKVEKNLKDTGTGKIGWCRCCAGFVQIIDRLKAKKL